MTTPKRCCVCRSLAHLLLADTDPRIMIDLLNLRILATPLPTISFFPAQLCNKDICRYRQETYAAEILTLFANLTEKMKKDYANKRLILADRAFETIYEFFERRHFSETQIRYVTFII